jgi:multidrug efflux pump subunit AcrA (membrane-fusion protein)
MKTKLPLYLIAVGVAIIALQNAGIIRPLRTPYVAVAGSVAVTGSVDIDNTVDVTGSVDINNTVDVNLAEVVGTMLVQSKDGMAIGVSSTANTVIPISWGEISISR